MSVRQSMWIVMAALAVAAACTSSSETVAIGADIKINAGPGVSEEVAGRAVRVALGDPRFASFLVDPTSAEVRTHEYGMAREKALLVDILLGRPRDEADLPPMLSVCARVVRSGPVTAVRWLLDAGGREILAVTPMWGTAANAACF